jgi:hypothetical protein
MAKPLLYSGGQVDVLGLAGQESSRSDSDGSFDWIEWSTEHRPFEAQGKQECRCYLQAQDYQESPPAAGGQAAR